MQSVAEKYHETYHETTLETTEKFFEFFPENVLSSGDMNVVFSRLSDLTFLRVRSNPLILINKKFAYDCFLENGDNVHLIKAFGSGYRGFREIIRILDLKYNPKTISWYRDDFKKLHLIKGE
jgi:hypothetical protein